MKAARVTESCILGADIVDLVLPPKIAVTRLSPPCIRDWFC